MEHLKFDPRNFWYRVFSSLPITEEIEVSGHKIFKIPFHEAIYFCQLFRPTRESTLQPTPYLSVYENDEKKPVFIPPSCAPLNSPHPELGSETQLNPLFAPSLDYISNEFPNFFKHKQKFLAIHEIGSDFSKEEILKNFTSEGHHMSQLLIFDIPFGWATHRDSGVGTNRAYVAEPIMEYLASVYFRNKGYIVDKFEERLSSSRKNLDLFAVYAPDMQNILNQYNFGGSGVYLSELERPLWKDEKKPPKRKKGKDISVAIEAESSRRSESNGYNQLEIDLSHREFNHGYLAVPFKVEMGREDVGIVTFDTEGSLHTIDCSENHAEENKSSQLLERVRRIIKLILLKNIPLPKTLELLPTVNTFWEIYAGVEEVPLERVIKYVK